jgi:hypothetical protein
MKQVKTVLFYVTFWLLLMMLGCKNENNPIEDNNTPGLVLTSSKIHTVQGRQIVIEGTVSDPVGIASITIKNDLWYLNKQLN